MHLLQYFSGKKKNKNVSSSSAEEIRRTLFQKFKPNTIKLHFKEKVEEL
jgi:hypothetical protein